MKPFLLLLTVLLAACTNYCSVNSAREAAEQAIEASLSPGLDPKFKWVQDSVLGGNITLLRGSVEINTIGGPRASYKTTTRVWCDGATKPEATLVYITNLLDREFNEAGHDTALTRIKDETARAVEEITMGLDSMLEAHKASSAETGRFLDSLEGK